MVEVGGELWRSSGPTLVLTGICEASEMHFYVPRNNFQKWPRKNNLRMVGLELQKGMGEERAQLASLKPPRVKINNQTSVLVFYSPAIIATKERKSALRSRSLTLLWRGKADGFLLQIINKLYGFCSVSVVNLPL